MQKTCFFIVTLILVLLPHLLPGQSGRSHFSIAEGPDPVFREIEQAYRNGELTLDEQLHQKFLVATRPGEVMERFREEAANVRLRCLTPLLMEFETRKEELSPATRNEIEILAQSVCSKPSTDFTYTSESGRFRLYYSLDGPHAVPSHEYVETAAFAADSSWNHQIGRIGFADPVTAPQLAPYEIYFRDFSPYGVTCSSGLSSYIVVNNNFEDGFPPNQHPEGDQIGALYVTIAHELKHASQYATYSGVFSDTWFDWVEMDATMMEEEVFDDVNDYYHYLKSDGLTGSTPNSSSIFGAPELPTPGAYWHVSWMLYFAESLGMEFWREVWERIRRTPTLPFLNAIRGELNDSGERFGEHHIQNMIWHQASGPGYAADTFGFQERFDYPNPAFFHTFHLIPDSLSAPVTLEPLAARFHRVQPPGERHGQVLVELDHDHPDTGIGLTAYFLDGSSAFTWQAGSGNYTELLTSWRWQELRELTVTVVNANSESSSRYQLRIDHRFPEEVTLSENYPNPFYPTTRIRFGIDRAQQVRLEIYDVLGRRIQVITDRHFEAGFHEVEFDGGGLASGLYLYQIITGGERRSRNMLLLR